MPIPMPMAIAVYFTTWWIVLFAVLPFGVRPQGDAVPGSDPGAPAAPHLVVKALWTTGLSAVAFLLILAMFAYL